MRIAYETDVRIAPDFLVQGTKRPDQVESVESFMPLEMQFWIRDVQNGIRNISNDVQLEIRDLFLEHGVTIPMLQHGIYINRLSLLTVNLSGSPTAQLMPT